MNQLTTFNFNGLPVRISIVDGEPKFHANDVCQILAYSNPRQALDTHVEKDDVQKLDTING